MGKKHNRIKTTNLGNNNADIVVYTDGGCDYNPGGKGAYGIVILHQKTGKYESYTEAFASTTNNRMELLAVVVALEHIDTSAPVIAYSDSRYVVQTANNKWRRYRNLDLWNRFDKAMQGKNVLFIWVKGHKGNYYNELCDEICTRSMNEGPFSNDAGYTNPQSLHEDFYKAIENEKTIGDAMSVDIYVPPQLNERPPFMSPRQYADNYSVHTTCAKSICDFYYLGRKDFDAYVKIKTGGKDYWSAFRENELKRLVGEEKWGYIQQYLHGQGALIAAKWCCRGLALEDSIRKALVDIEANNAYKKYTDEKQV